MLQETVLRMAERSLFAEPIIVCNDEHRFIVAEQLRAIDISPRAIVLEPEGRNTAPAAALAAAILSEGDPEALILLAPSDHVIADTEAFHRAARSAMAAASQEQALVTFGVKPDKPETGYGYIRQGEEKPAIEGCHKVDEFVEKPSLEVAESYLKAGTYLWNSGMFLFSASSYLSELEKWEPEIASACKQAIAGCSDDMDFLRPDAESFAASPAISIDYAVMERTDKAMVVSADMGWSDVGSWSSLWQVSEQDADGNAVSGDVVMHDVHDTYIKSEGPLVAAVGVRDLVVVATKDAVLAVHKDRAQDVKIIVDKLRAAGREEPDTHTVVYRPWGSYETLDEGPGFKVKRIVVKPGAQLSLQMHHSRAEHWVVVDGTAIVTRDEETFTLTTNQSTYIPLEATHRLENPEDTPLQLIEIQSGDYLGEDDIVRFEDTYGRS